MISATAWIARGKSARHPKRYDLDDGELERVSRMANVNLQEAKAQLEQAQNDLAMGHHRGDDDDDDEWRSSSSSSSDSDKDDDGDEAMATEETSESKPTLPEDADDLSKYNLHEYDDDAPVGVAMGAFSNIKGLQFYRSNDEDPYITVRNDKAGLDAEQDEEREELEIYASDNLVLTAKTEDDVSQLEAYVYAANDANLYVHHDVMLPSFALCLEWMDYTPAPFDADQNGASASRPERRAGTAGSYVAVGTMDPEIEIWSMDVVDGLYPDAILGRKQETADLGLPLGTGKKKKKLTRTRTPNAEYHVDAVLSLSWNPVARNLLASASADTTVKLWDLSRPHTGQDSSALRSFDAHSDKVQSVAWQAAAPGGGGAGSANPAVLLTGSYDKTLRIFDTRTPDVAVGCRIETDVEAVRWNGWRENEFLVAMESGLVQAFDARALPSYGAGSGEAARATWTLNAHDGACTSLDISPHMAGCFITGGSDKTVKIWNLDSSSAAASINLVASRDLGVGKVFSATFSPSDPVTLAAAGSAGKLHIWNALTNLGVRKTFADRLAALQGEFSVDFHAEQPARGDGVVGVVDDDEEDDDEEEMEA
ncbi:rRNA-processing protein [Thecaphora frezii]